MTGERWRLRRLTLAITWPQIVLEVNLGSAVAAQVDGDVVQPDMTS